MLMTIKSYQYKNSACIFHVNVNNITLIKNKIKCKFIFMISKRSLLYLKNVYFVLLVNLVFQRQFMYFVLRFLFVNIGVHYFCSRRQKNVCTFVFSML